MNAESVITGLMQRGYPRHIAVGIAGNLAVESGFNPGINEISPLVEGSRGGFGLAQWTGPRRVQFEDYAAKRGAALDDFDAQLDFLTWELGNTERRAGEKLASAQTPEDAARIFSESFLRPGIPHLDRRIAEASKLAGIPDSPASYQPQNTLAQGTSLNPEAQQNALAQVGPRVLSNQLDPRAFTNSMSGRNRLAIT